MTTPGSRDLSVSDVRVFVPSSDFAQSRAFYAALGWATIWTDDEGLALIELGGHRLMLQNYFVRDWAENFMVTVEVASAQDWHDHVVECWPRVGSATHASPNPRPRTGVQSSPTCGTPAACCCTSPNGCDDPSGSLRRLGLQRLAGNTPRATRSRCIRLAMPPTSWRDDAASDEVACVVVAGEWLGFQRLGLG